MAYGARLESVLGESPRGFESPILRSLNFRDLTSSVEISEVPEKPRLYETVTRSQGFSPTAL